MDEHIHIELDILEMLGVLYARSAACLSVIRADYSRHEQEYLKMMYSEEDIVKRAAWYKYMPVIKSLAIPYKFI